MPRRRPYVAVDVMVGQRAESESGAVPSPSAANQISSLRENEKNEKSEKNDDQSNHSQSLSFFIKELVR
jgi:hypothetical protein